jgi:hypothetical protein
MHHTSHEPSPRRPAGRGVAIVAVAALAFAACDDDDGDSVEPTDTIVQETLSSVAGQPYPTAELTIRHQAPQAEVDVTYTLTCSSADASLDGDEVEVDAQAACAALGDPAVIDWLAEGPPDDQVCTEQFGGEDTATIGGEVEAAPIDVTVDRVDGCGISTWDELLAPLLPPAVGVT